MPINFDNLYTQYMHLFKKQNRPNMMINNSLNNVIKNNANQIITKDQFKTRYNYWKEYLKEKENDKKMADELCNQMDIKETCDTDCLKSIADCPKQQKKLAKIANLYNIYNSDTVEVQPFSNLNIFDLNPDEEELFIKVMTWFDIYVNSQNESMGGKRKSYRRKNPKKKTRKYRRKSVRRH